MRTTRKNGVGPWVRVVCRVCDDATVGARAKDIHNDVGSMLAQLSLNSGDAEGWG